MITRKIKIGNFFYSHSRSIQNIAHHMQSLFDGVISERGAGGGACMSFFVTQPISLPWTAPYQLVYYTRLLVIRPHTNVLEVNVYRKISRIC